MVTFVVVSEYSQSPPLNGGGLKIAGGPLYDLARIQAVADQGRGLRFWTRKCESNAQALGLDAEDAAGLLCELQQPRNFRNSEWCTDGRVWAACDAYALERREWVNAARKHMNIEYFLKFALAKTGALVLMVSCHTSS
jgi:hypothetical protein